MTIPSSFSKYFPLKGRRSSKPGRKGRKCCQDGKFAPLKSRKEGKPGVRRSASLSSRLNCPSRPNLPTSQETNTSSVVGDILENASSRAGAEAGAEVGAGRVFHVSCVSRPQQRPPSPHRQCPPDRRAVRRAPLMSPTWNETPLKGTAGYLPSNLLYNGHCTSLC